ncbi:MAG: hypothetical protein RLZZ303_1624 [Candidatus Hydrogenedentota bacterium]|jgi:hypothetical protein
MSAGRRVAKGILLLLPWLLLAPLAAELCMAVVQYTREANNPYVLAFEQGAPWPDEDAESALLHQVPKADDTRLPLFDPLRRAAITAAYLHHADDTRFQNFAHGHQCALAEFHGDAITPARHELFNQSTSPTPTEWMPLLDAAPVLEGIPAPQGYRDFRSIEVESWQVVRFNTDASVVTLLTHYLPYEPAPPESPYDRPFFSFKPHGQAPQGTTYLGVPEFRLNNHGFRDDDVLTPKPRDTFRIVCIGASTTMEGPTNGFTYPNLTEGFLREALPGRKIEVINAGISGLNSFDEFNRLPDYLAMQPDALVIYEGVNDICHLQIHAWRAKLPMGGFSLNSRIISALLGSHRLPSDSDMRRDYLDGGLGNYLAMADYARRCGISAYLCTFAHPDTDNLSPDEWTYYNRDARLNWVGRGLGLEDYTRAIRAWNAELKAQAQANDFPLIDIAAKLTGGGRIFGDICHMKDYGIEQKARIVAEGLEPEVRAFFGAAQ